MWMVSLKDHGYNGRRRAPGEVYEVRSEKDAIVLRVANLARDAKKSEMPAPTVREGRSRHVVADAPFDHSHKIPLVPTFDPSPPPAPTSAAPVDPPVAAAQPEGTRDDSDAIVYEQQSSSAAVHSREEEPEGENQKRNTLSSDSPKGSKRDKRRHYNRHDMEPKG